MDEPFCVCGCPNGFSNELFRETGDLRDQWLCAGCHKPAQQLFMSTDRWAPERAAWLWHQSASELDSLL